MRSPLVDQAFARFVANADCGVGAFADASFQPGADAGALGCMDVSVSDIEVWVDDVVVPTFEERRDVFLHHGVG